MRKVQQQIQSLVAMQARNKESTVIGKQVAAKLRAARGKLQELQGAQSAAQAAAEVTKRRKQLLRF